jgi:hypothetical protein
VYQPAPHLVRVECGKAQVDVHLLQFHQFHIKTPIVPGGVLVGFVIRDTVCLDPGGRESDGNVHRHHFQPQFERGLVPGVPHDDDAYFVEAFSRSEILIDNLENRA